MKRTQWSPKKKYNTHWSSPKTNIFAGLLSLRQCLASGRNAELIRLRNEECEFPLQYKEDPKNVDFRGYKFSIGYQSTYNKILADTSSPYNQHLSLNYKSVFGTDEAIKRYYETGVLTSDNLKGMGRNHLVKVDDLITYYGKQPDAWSKERAVELYSTYKDPATRDQKHWFDFFTKEYGNEWQVKKYNHKLWVVNMLDDNEPRVTPLSLRILNILIAPVVFIMKWTPTKDVMNMKEYKLTTFRVGGIINGFSVQFHTPKKFSFK